MKATIQSTSRTSGRDAVSLREQLGLEPSKSRPFALGLELSAHDIEWAETLASEHHCRITFEHPECDCSRWILLSNDRCANCGKKH